MLTALLLATSLYFCSVKADLQDFNDEEFAALVESHAKAAEFISNNAETAARGCVKGAVAAGVVGKGIQALCLGCVAGAAGETVADLTFPRGRKEE